MVRKKKDVKEEEEVASSPTPEEEEGVKPEEETVEETQTQETPEETPSEVGEPQVEAVDERGITYKNLAAEWKRKHEEFVEKLPQMLDEKFTQYSQQQPQKRSIAELETFAQQQPEYAPWAREEIAKLQREEFAKIVDEKFKQSEQQKQGETKKQQALGYVMQNYPQCFVKDNQGKVVGWNNSSPLTRQISQLMQDPEISKNPQGLIAAADIAYARSVRVKGTQEKKELQSKVKELQKQTLTEGGGTVPTETVPVKDALAKLRQSGSLKDAKAAVEEIFKARRLAKEG